ncbi:hypothetical protein [Caulobacter segnis]|nr:hypothetical protein [Caulobacter segnis]
MRIDLAPSGAPVPAHNARRVDLIRSLAVGGSMAIWLVILLGLRLIAV